MNNGQYAAGVLRGGTWRGVLRILTTRRKRNMYLARTIGAALTCAHPLRVLYTFTNGPAILGCATCDVGSHVAARNSPRLTPEERAAWARVES